MSYQLDFSIRRRINTSDIGITIPAMLARNQKTVLCDAKVDTGSEYCFFQNEIAVALGLNVESGIPITLGTLAGTISTYAHTIQLHTLGIVYESTVLFSAHPGLPRNILGRVGWLENLHLALTMDDEMIYLNPAYSE
jgi:hypothetical protein